MFKLSILFAILLISVTNGEEFNHLCEGHSELFVDDPRTCPAFFRCVNGIASEDSCPEPFYFNPIYILCDWPENVDCETPTTTEPPQTPPTPSPTPGPTPPPPPTITCPETGSQLFPHPQTCTLFVLCFGGTPIELECPPGKHFSEAEQTCVDPELANCEIDHTACHGVEDFGRIPSTIDCNEYFVCVNNTSIRRNCAEEAHFNPVELRCESRHTAGCLIRPDPEDHLPECPADEFFVVLPHPYSCNHYFYCVNGVGKIQECAPGFLFDTDRLVCDDSTKVECLIV